RDVMSGRVVDLNSFCAPKCHQELVARRLRSENQHGPSELRLRWVREIDDGRWPRLECSLSIRREGFWVASFHHLPRLPPIHPLAPCRRPLGCLGVRIEAPTPKSLFTRFDAFISLRDHHADKRRSASYGTCCDWHPRSRIWHENIVVP